MKKVCILCFENMAWDRRILRQIIFASKHYEVDVIAYDGWLPIEGVRLLPVTQKAPPAYMRYGAYVAGKLAPKLWEEMYWRYQQHQEAYQILVENKYDIIHANDWDAIPVAVRGARKTNAKVLFDAHENYLEQYAENKIWKWMIAPFRKYLMHQYDDISGMITVSRAFKEFYKEEFGWDGQVIMSAAQYLEMPFRSVNSERIEIVHHGIALKQRHIEKIIDVVALLDERFHLNLILLSGKRSNCLQELKDHAEKVAEGRVTFLDPIPPEKLIYSLNKFDIAIPFMYFKQGNYFLTLPNKFFDAIMAGLAIIVSPQPMMAEIVRQNDIGLVSRDQSPESMAALLDSLSAKKIDELKRHSLELAKTMNAEIEMDKLMKIYADLVKG